MAPRFCPAPSLLEIATRKHARGRADPESADEPPNKVGQMQRYVFAQMCRRLELKFPLASTHFHQGLNSFATSGISSTLNALFTRGISLIGSGPFVLSTDAPSLFSLRIGLVTGRGLASPVSACRHGQGSSFRWDRSVPRSTQPYAGATAGSFLSELPQLLAPKGVCNVSVTCPNGCWRRVMHPLVETAPVDSADTRWRTPIPSGAPQPFHA